MIHSKFPLISIVIPVYNAEKYLVETIESVVDQDIGFQDNIEIILINDGSTDGSESICNDYKNKYPKNITYIKQQNAGVSAARNKGIDVAQGKYIAFLDSDDKYSKDAVRKVCEFFEEHYEEVDVVAIKLVFFDAKTGGHMLNYKFSETRVVDIEKEPECVQLSGGSIFVKTETVHKRFYFDPTIKFSEDSKFITELILEKLKYGVVSGPALYYRRRQEQDSAINISTLSREWYIDTTQKVYQYLFDYSVQTQGHVLRYVQHLVAYDLQWRLRQSRQTVLSPDDEKHYKRIIYSLLKQIDDGVIMAQRWLPLEFKIFALKKKYGANYEKSIRIESGCVYIKETLLWDYAKKPQRLNIDFITEQSDGTLKLEGFVVKPATDKLTVQLLIGDKLQEIKKVNRKYLKPSSFLGAPMDTGFGFEAIVKAHNPKHIQGVLVGDDGAIVVMPLNFRLHTRIGNMDRSYCRIGRYIATNRSNYSLHVARHSHIANLVSEAVFSYFALRSAAFDQVKERGSAVIEIEGNLRSDIYLQQDKLDKSLIKRFRRFGGLCIRQVRKKGTLRYVQDLLRVVAFVYLRQLVGIVQLFGRHEVWLVSDRINSAGDNGEALFRYMQKIGTKNVKTYFAIAKDSPDFKKMKKVGKVVDRNGYKYKLLFLLSSKIISSHADDFVINPFTNHKDFFVSLFRFQFVFLQHGITKDDISGWLNRYSKNISLFITAANPEHKSIIEGGYHYSKDEVVLSGFPRYDELVSSSLNKLIIMPTWRKFIAVEADACNGSRPYDPNFNKTEYFKFYQRMLEDERLLQALETTGMTVEFYLHPSHKAQILDFKGGKQVQIMKFPFDYRKAFQEGDLLVTDYSSVAFDFAYMKKPIIYAQFDEEIFFGNHWERGYFSYAKHGFGPVVKNYEETVMEIIKIIESGCKMEDRYKKRVDEFFAFTDKNNSARVYEAILDMPK